MPKVAIPPYPEALTVKFWNKAKGLIARIKKIETGITAELEKARKAYDDAPWAQLQMETFIQNNSKKQGSKTKQDYEDLLRVYLEKMQPPFKKLEAVFHDLSSTLKQKARIFEDDDQLKQFAKPVLVMADAANKFTYAVAWGTMSSPQQGAMADYIKQAAQIEAQWTKARGDLTDMIDKADKAITKAKGKPPNASGYAVLWKQELRGIGAQIAMAGKGDPQILVKFKAPMQVAKTQWNEKNMPGDGDVPDRLKKDLTLIGQFKQALTAL